jgi:AcrR family transcriptional regulator
MVQTQQDVADHEDEAYAEDAQCPRRPRADARRNRAKVLAAAEKVLAEQGLDAPIDAIAHEAGVGVGTCYRHFPTKRALLEAVVEAHFEPLIEIAKGLLDSADPGEAYFEYIEAAVRASTHKAVAQSIAESDPEVQRRRQEWSSVLTEHSEKLLQRSQEAGAIRDDVTHQDVRVMLGGICLANDRLSLDPRQRDRAIALLRAALTDRNTPLD